MEKLDFSSFSDKELKLHKENILRIIEDFMAYAFHDWTDPVFNGVHDMYFAILEEQDRRADEREAKRVRRP